MSSPTDPPLKPSSPAAGAGYAADWALFADWCTATNSTSLPADWATVLAFTVASYDAVRYTGDRDAAEIVVAAADQLRTPMPMALACDCSNYLAGSVHAIWRWASI